MVLNYIPIFKICPFLYLFNVELCTYTQGVCQRAWA